MSVHRVFDRLRGNFSDLGNQFIGRNRREECVDDQDTRIANDEARVARRQAPGFRYCAINALGYFDQLKVVFGLWRSRASKPRSARCGQAGQRQPEYHRGCCSPHRTSSRYI